MKTLYFAYGSNMDPEQMAFRCPGAEPVGRATLHGYRFLINQCGYATLAAVADARTPGILWRISKKHEKTLDGYEGYRSGLYDKCFRLVDCGSEGDRRCLVYIDHCHQTPSAPNPGYMERVYDAAVEGGLPEDHVAFLREWLPAQN